MIQHIPGEQNVVADGLTRVTRTSLMEIQKHKRHLFVDDSIQRIFRLDEEGSEEENPEEVQKESGGEKDYDAYGIVEMHEVLSRYHNSIWV